MKRLLCLLVACASLQAQKFDPDNGFQAGLLNYLWVIGENNIFGWLADPSHNASFEQFLVGRAPTVNRGAASRDASVTTTGSLATTFSPTSYVVVTPFASQFPGGGPGFVQPVAPQNPRLIFVDGFGSGVVAIDMGAFKIASQVPGVEAFAGPLAVRPNAAGAVSEVWAAEGGTDIAVADLNAQTVAARILTASIPKTATPVGLAFSPDGATAFEAVHFASGDSAGNNGALLVFNAATRTVTSTFLVKTGPNAMLLAPDGSTAYILSSNGSLTYYDVLSGTADFTVQTVQPGSGFGYPGFSSAVGIHPDGTRIFWNVGVYLVTYNLTTHSIVSQFNSGLPTTVGRTFSLSQDGELAYFSDPLGDVALVSTYDGTVLASFNTGSPTAVWGAPPVAP